MVYRARYERMQALETQRDARTLEDRQIVVQAIADAQAAGSLDTVGLVVNSSEARRTFGDEPVIPNGFLEHEHPASDQVFATLGHIKIFGLNEGMVEGDCNLALSKRAADFHVMEKPARRGTIAPAKFQLKMEATPHGRQGIRNLLTGRLCGKNAIHR